jgi:hypothetical protein
VSVHVAHRVAAAAPEALTPLMAREAFAVYLERMRDQLRPAAVAEAPVRSGPSR